MKHYLLKECIHCGPNSFFDVPPGMVNSKYIRIESTQDVITISYGIRSPLPPEDILKLRPQLSQLVQGIFGDGFQSYDTELYLIEEDKARVVGFVRLRIPNLTGTPLLSNPAECILLLYMILDTQLRYKSDLVDGLFAVLSKANMGGFVNTSFAWAWWGFEWLVQHLDNMNPVPRTLDFKIKKADGTYANLRRLFKKQIIEVIDQIIQKGETEFTINPKQIERFHEELNYIRQQINSSLLKPTFSMMYKNQIPYFSRIINEFLIKIKQSPFPVWNSVSNIKTMFGNWDKISEEIILPAKKARDSGFHIGRYSGILEGERFEIYSGMRKFVGWVCTLLAIILTRSPSDFDSQYKPRFEFEVLPDALFPMEELSIGNDGIMEWTTSEKDRVTKHSTPISQIVLTNDWTLEFKVEKTPEYSQRGCLTETREVRNANFCILVDKIRVEGKFISEENRSIIKIHRLLVDPQN